jgi:hypothetical protein
MEVDKKIQDEHDGGTGDWCPGHSRRTEIHYRVKWGGSWAGMVILEALLYDRLDHRALLCHEAIVAQNGVEAIHP